MTALNAEAGSYDIIDGDDRNNDGVHGDFNRSSSSIGGNGSVTATPEKENGEQEGAERAATAAAEAVLAGAPITRSGIVTGKVKGGDDDDQEGDRSECSTRPVSAQSSSREDEDNETSDRSNHGGDDDVIVESAGDNRASAASRQNSMAEGGAVRKETNEVPGRESEEEEGGDTSTAPDEKGANVGGLSGSGGDGDDGGDDMERKKEKEDNGRAEAVLLREMLERLNSGEWNGAVNTVLDAIESLTRWIPTPPLLPSNDNQVMSPPGRGGDVPDRGGGLATDNVLRGSSGGGGGGNAKYEAGNVGLEKDGEEDQGDEEEDEEEEEEEGEEEEGEEEGEEGDEEEEEGDDETDSDEDEAGQHPVYVEQKAMRAQWRRLMLDAQLEPETDCTDLMRETVGNMAKDIAGAMEGVRREAAASADAGGKSAAAETQTPRGGVLGYDEVSEGVVQEK